MNSRHIYAAAIYEIGALGAILWIFPNVTTYSNLYIFILAIYNAVSFVLSLIFLRGVLSGKFYDFVLCLFVAFYSIVIIFFGISVYFRYFEISSIIENVLFFSRAIDYLFAISIYSIASIVLLLRIEFLLFKKTNILFFGVRTFFRLDTYPRLVSRGVPPGPPSILAFSDIGKRRQLVVIHLVDRARTLQMRANYVLFAIGILIVSGVLLIFFAGEIVSTDAQTESKLKQIRSLISDYESASGASVQLLSSTEGDLANIASSLMDMGVTISVVDESVLFKKPIDVKFTDDQAKKYYDLTNRYASLFVVRSATRDRLFAQRKMISAVEADIPNNISTFVEQEKPHSADSGLLVASAITRFGILLIIVFLVQILVGIYRYSLKLAAFYNSRADALLLTPGNVSSLGIWDQLMLPRDIDFGRTPVPPSQYVAEIVQSVFSRIKQNDKAKTIEDGSKSQP